MNIISWSGSAIRLSYLFLTLLAIMQLSMPQTAESQQAEYTLASESHTTGLSLTAKGYSVEKIIVNAPREQVWKVLTDYAHAASVFPCMVKSFVLEDDGTAKLIDQTIRPSFLVGPMEYVLALKETAPSLLEFHRVRGALRENQGYWKLDSVDDGKRTLVTLSKYVDTGMFIPKIIVDHLLASTMPQILIALKTHAEMNSQVR